MRKGTVHVSTLRFKHTVLCVLCDLCQCEISSEAGPCALPDGAEGPRPV